MDKSFLINCIDREKKIFMEENQETKISLGRRIWMLYADGFRNMTIGKYLWAIILVKLFILFIVFRLFFFPNILSRDYDNDEDRAQAVRTNLLKE